MPATDPNLLAFEARMASRYRWLFADWSSTLAAEGQRLEALLRPHGVERVLDTACGAGTQSIPLAERGFRVVACDISAAMLGELRAQAAARGQQIPCVVGDFRALPIAAGRFDAALCCGNALAHCLTEAQLAAALGELRRVVRPGGVLVADLRNYDTILRERPRFQFRQLHERPEGRLLVFDLWDYHADGTLTFNIIFTREGPQGWTTECLATLQAPHRPEAFLAAVRAAGFRTAHTRVTPERVGVLGIAV